MFFCFFCLSNLCRIEKEHRGGGGSGMVLQSWAKIGDYSNYSTRNLSLISCRWGSLIWPCCQVQVCDWLSHFTVEKKLSGSIPRSVILRSDPRIQILTLSRILNTVDSWLSLSLPLVIVADCRVLAVGVLVVYCRCMSTVVRSCCLLIVVHRFLGGYRLLTAGVWLSGQNLDFRCPALGYGMGL